MTHHPARVRLSIQCRVSIACLFILFPLDREARALDPHKSIAQYAHESWSTKDGLPEADVMAILQTKDSYLWLGTEEGVARFDGAHFVVFDRRTASLPSNRIVALAETADDGLWIGTENGLSQFKDRRFINYAIHDGLPSNGIRALWSEDNGTLWVTTVAGVRIWQGKGFERVPSVEPVEKDSPRQVLRALNGDIWIATDTSLSRIGIAGTTKIAADLGTLHGSIIRTIMMDPAGVLWVGTNTGLYRLIEGRIEQYSLGYRSQPEVTTLLEDRHHNLWVGTLADGLIRINTEGISHYSVANGLSAVEVKSLYEDRTGNLWVGTFGGGLEVFRDSMFTPYGKAEGVSQDVVWAVTEDRDSNIWIGTQAGGLNRLKDSKVTIYSVRDGSSDNTVGSLFEGLDGTLWLGKDSGLSKFDEGKVRGVPLLVPSLHEQVHTIYEDRDGTAWVGTRTSGLLALRGAKRQQFSTQNGLAGNNVQTVIPSKNGGIWVGTLDGLSYYQNGHFINFSRKDGLSADQVLSLYEDSEGILWIGTNGLNRLKDGKVTTYGDREGLFDQDVLGILEDGNGYLWLSSNKGISRVSRRQLNDIADRKASQLTTVIFGTGDGMRSAECNGGSSPSAWKDHRGNLWFATVAGAVKLDPRWMDANPQSLQVHVEDVWADRRHVEPSMGMTLPPGGHELEFHYSAPYFAGVNRVRYKYRLEGFDKEWVDAGTRTVAYYTNLPSGSYQFRVVASAFNARPRDAEAELGFYLMPHFYQTRTFYILTTMVGLGMILLVWRWTNRIMIARQNELKRLVEMRTCELEAEKAELQAAKAALAEQVSHDSLTGLLNRGAISRILEEDVFRAERERTSLAVLLVDIDHFKHINDTCGHLAGDDVLREFARRLKINLRPYDHAGRFGGEEFLVVMPGLDEDAEDRIHVFQQQLCVKHYVSPGIELGVTCSIGVVWFYPGTASSEALLKLADDALYVAKAKGRNRVEKAERVPINSK